MNAPVVPVASHSVEQDPGAGHAGAQLPRPELNDNAWPFPAPSCDPVPVAGPAAPSSDEGPAPQLLPPTNLPALAPASAPVPVPVPVAAPSDSLRAASLAPESSREDPFAELSPGPVSVAPLLHPQRQRELIEQAAGMSTRQVAGLLAAAAPEVVPPRDTLRAVAPDRYTFKVSIDQECEQGLRLLKDLMSHLDPRMSWGHLVARMVREAVAWHDPRGDGNGHRRRRSAGSAGASPSRAPNKTRAAGAAAETAQRASESSGRAPSRGRTVTPPLPEGKTRSRCWPTLLHRGSQRPLHWQTALAQVALHGPRPLLLRRGSRAAPRPMAPLPALACRARRSPLRRRSRHSACPLTADRAAHQPGQRSKRPASAAATNPRHGATFPRLSGATSGIATEDAAVIAIRSPGAAAPLPICCRSTTCCRCPRRWPGAVQPPVGLRSPPQNAPRPRTGCAAGAPDVAPPPLCCPRIINQADEVKYGGLGLLIPLNDLVDEWAPNVAALFERVPQARLAATTPSGNIYSLPNSGSCWIGSSPVTLNIHTGWLQQAGMGIPTDIDQFEAALTWFRDHDMNGNGDTGDEIPFGMLGGNIEQLMSIFGVVDAQGHRMVIEDKVFFTADEPEVKAAIEWLHDIYQKGLIDLRPLDRRGRRRTGVGRLRRRAAEAEHRPPGRDLAAGLQPVLRAQLT